MATAAARDSCVRTQPTGWRVGIVADAVAQLQAGVSVNSVAGESGRTTSGPSILKTSAVSQGTFIPEECKPIAERDLARAKLAPRANSILVSRMNTPALVGECGFVPADFPQLFVPDRIWMMTLRPEIDARWLSYLLSSLAYRRLIKEQATGTSGSMKNIAKDAFLSLPVMFPPYEEQRRIAASVDQVDSAVLATAAAIAKKRELKQAVMQQLLTGQTRLPGFSGDWEERRLGEMGHWRGGVTPSMAEGKFWDGGSFPWVSSGDVKVPRLSQTSSQITSFAVQAGAAVVVPAGSLLVVMRSGILRRYLPVAVVERDMAINQDIKALVPLPGYSSDFLLQLLTLHGKHILESCMKSGTTVESIELSWLKSLVLPMPQHDEQVHIAAVLADLDAELEALESRRTKTLALKQAMMHELLTGRTRLV